MRPAPAIRSLTWLLAALIAACRPDPAGQSATAFYHWQTHFAPDTTERQYLAELGVTKLYVKYFDVDWDAAREMPVPHAEVKMDTTRLPAHSITPTVFITNRTLSQCGTEGAPELADRIARKIIALGQPPVTEIQIDCDWTASTREAYFQLLQRLRAAFPQPLTLSVTVRLHQLRYPQRTGVPPADRGMLMCYNVGELEAWAEENSILQAETVRPYLEEAPPYPLPLDVALPLFRWGVVFRDGQLVHLINELGPEQLTDGRRFVKLADNRYEVVKSTYLDSYYLYRGDRIRTESAQPEALEKTARLLRAHLGAPATIAWYHLDTTTIKRFPYATLFAIQAIFRE